MSAMKNVKNRMYLTKSLFQSSIECSRKLTYNMWLHQQQQQQQPPPLLGRDGSHIDRPLLRPILLQEPTAPSTFLQHLAADGYRMNRYVQRMYDTNGNGILVNSKDTEEAVRQTQQLLLKSSPTNSTDTTSTGNSNSKSTSTGTIIYEGAIRWKNCLIRADILQIVPSTNEHQPSHLKLVEVKAKSWDTSLHSSTTTTTTTGTSYDGDTSSINHPMMTKDGTAIKSDYQTILYDIAYQYYVLSQAYPQYTLTNQNVSCSFVLPDKSKVNTTIPGLYNLFDHNDLLQKEHGHDRLSFQSSPEREVLYTEVDVTPIIPLILHQPLFYPGCNDTHPKTFVEVIHEWNEIMERFNNLNQEDYAEGMSDLQDDPNNVTIMNQFISKVFNNDNDTNIPPTTTTTGTGTIPAAAPIGIHCRNCEFRTQHKNDCSATIEPTVKSGFDYCWGSMLKANAIVKNTGNEYHVTHTDDGCVTSSTPLSPQLVIDLYYGGKIVTEMLEQNKYLLCEITKKDLKLLDTTATDDANVNVEDSNKKDSKKKKKKTKTPSTAGISRKERQWYHVQSSFTNSNAVILDKDYLYKSLSEYEYPYHFIDFETIAPVLPFTINKHPYEPIAFQFSHHILHEDGTTTQHATEFIHTTPGICPNIHFLHAISDTFHNRYTDGTIFRWGSHENTILRSIYNSTIDETDRPSVTSMERFFGTGFSDDGTHISDIGTVQDGMIDLMSIILKGYYVKGSNGSASIKSLLLPTLQYSTHLRDLYEAPTYDSNNFNRMQWWKEDVPGSGIPIDPYKLLQCANMTDNDTGSTTSNSVVVHGGDAIAAYSMLQRIDIEMSIRQQIEKSLLRYCELDTLAMVMMMQALIGHLK
jgi:Domain of unknown function(DUF2779)